MSYDIQKIQQELHKLEASELRPTLQRAGNHLTALDNEKLGIPPGAFQGKSQWEKADEHLKSLAEHIPNDLREKLCLAIKVAGGINISGLGPELIEQTLTTITPYMNQGVNEGIIALFIAGLGFTLHHHFCSEDNQSVTDEK